MRQQLKGGKGRQQQISRGQEQRRGAAKKKAPTGTKAQGHKRESANGEMARGWTIQSANVSKDAGAQKERAPTATKARERKRESANGDKGAGAQKERAPTGTKTRGRKI